MNATELAELAAFEAVARHRSFRKASEERGVTASAVSHAVTALEARIGIRLLNRTTRSVAPTDAGAMLLARLQPAFGEIGDALDALNRFRDTPFGKVRINVPNSIAPFVIGPVMAPLLAANPNLQLEIVATDRLVDIVEEGFDAGIRMDESLRDGMTAVRIKPQLRFAVVGAPAYFARHGVPSSPDALKKHVCIRNLYPNGTPYPWEFGKGKRSVAFQPTGPLALDDHELMVAAATGGAGLAYVWADRAADAIAAGKLATCLEDWCAAGTWLYLYYPDRRHLSAGLRAVIDTMRV